ncbi:MAG: SRPBCC family protein [Pseudomonadota bacterium]
MIRHFGGLLALGTMLTSFPLKAEVAETSERGFVTRDEVVVNAAPKEVWLALIGPSKWWSAEHTWSGDAANLTLTPQAGGCFCEKIPEVDEPERFTLEGSVEHMRVVQAYPERALRMRGSLGPLQSEPASGVLTIAISEVDEGTKIVWEYNVGGEMRYEIPVIARAVDGVMSQQLAGLAKLLGPVEMPDQQSEAEPEPQTDPEPDAQSESEPAGEEAPPNEGAGIAGQSLSPDQEAQRRQTVDEAFKTLADEEL